MRFLSDPFTYGQYAYGFFNIFYFLADNKVLLDVKARNNVIVHLARVLVLKVISCLLYRRTLASFAFADDSILRQAVADRRSFFCSNNLKLLRYSTSMSAFRAFTGSCAPILCRSSVLYGSTLPNVSYAAASSSRSLFQNALRRSVSTHAGRPKPALKTPFQERWRRNASLLTDNQVIQRPVDSGAKWTRIASTLAVVVGGAG